MITTLAIWADDQALGIRCAKIKYGVDMINDVMRGYTYHGRDGMPIARLTKGEVREDDDCEKCKNPLYACNASEVTV
jgi:hypothetical protein